MTTGSDFRSNLARVQFGEPHQETQSTQDEALQHDADSKAGIPMFLRSNFVPAQSHRLTAVSSPTVAGLNDEPHDIPGSPILHAVELHEPPAFDMQDAVQKPFLIQAITEQDQTQFGGPTESIGKTLIPQGWTFTGQIAGESDMRFECNLVADIECTNAAASIELGTSCKSEGTLKGKHIRVQGEHKGAIDAAGGRVVMEANSKITGDVTYSQIQINDGTRHNFALHYVGNQGESDVGTNA
jgi:cytoskeletal protein CcmA (bactofilin family)